MNARRDSGRRAKATVTRLSPTSESDQSPLVPAGTYELAFHHYSLARRFDRDVLELWFVIQDLGPHFGINLPRYYNVIRSNGKRRFFAKPNSAFTREYCALFGNRPKFKTSPISRFESVLVQGCVEVVSCDYRQRKIAEEARYSTIRELRRVL